MARIVQYNSNLLNFYVKMYNFFSCFCCLNEFSCIAMYWYKISIEQWRLSNLLGDGVCNHHTLSISLHCKPWHSNCLLCGLSVVQFSGHSTSVGRYELTSHSKLRERAAIADCG